MTQSRPEGGGDLPEAERVAEILSGIWERPEFATAEPSWIARVLGDLRAALFEWITGLLSGIGLPGNWVSGLGQIVTVLFITLGILAIALLIRRALRSGLRTSQTSHPLETRPTPSRSSDPDEWERLAREAAAAGRFREASLALYRSVILRLAAAGMVRVLEGRTPGDYATEARARGSSIAEPFQRFLQVFHPVAFGPGVPDSLAFERLTSAAAEVTRRTSPVGSQSSVADRSVNPDSSSGARPDSVALEEESDG